MIKTSEPSSGRPNRRREPWTGCRNAVDLHSQRLVPNDFRLPPNRRIALRAHRRVDPVHHVPAVFAVSLLDLKEKPQSARRAPRPAHRQAVRFRAPRAGQHRLQPSGPSAALAALLVVYSLQLPVSRRRGADGLAVADGGCTAPVLPRSKGSPRRAHATRSEQRQGYPTRADSGGAGRAEPLDRAGEAFAPGDGGAPAEDFAGAGEVGAAAVGVVEGAGDAVDRGLRPRRSRAAQLDDRLGRLTDGDLGVGAAVDRLEAVAVGGAEDRFDEIGDVTEGAGLPAVTVDGHGLSRQGLLDEGGQGTAVVGAHPRAVGVEDADHAGADAVDAVIGHGQGLGEAFALVVGGTRADGVDVAPVGLRLGVDQRVAVALAG